MSDDVEQPDSGQVPAQASQESPNAGPWADDLALLFQDDATRAQVDQFIRAKVQPYTTKLEQDVAQYRTQLDSDEYKAKEELYSAFQEDPNGTTATIIQQLYPQQAAEVLEYLNGQDAYDQSQQEPQKMEIPQEYQQMYAHYEQQQAEAAYAAEKAQFLAANPDINGDYIDAHVTYTANEDGTCNWDAAKQSYEAQVAALTPKQEQIDLGIKETKAVESSDAKPDNAEDEYVYKRGDDPWAALAKGIKSIAPTTV